MRPETEEWAVLVNEFGEIGIDGALLQSSGVSVKEIPGVRIAAPMDFPCRLPSIFFSHVNPTV